MTLMDRLIGSLMTACAVSLALIPTAPHAHEPEEELAEIAAFFARADIVAGPEIVDCTLSGGTQTQCFQITVRPNPQDYTPGPWCPTQISDGPDQGGIWFVDGQVRDVDGDFITQLAEIYGDTDWQLFDPETGAVRYTGTLEGCEAAARPDVDPDYQNYCVQCLPEYLPEEASVTYVIPLEPVMADRPALTRDSGAGLAWNGVRLDGPAPVGAILSAHTLAPFDDCGGHVNLHVGYHYHAVTDCLDNPPASTAFEGYGAQIGIAMDGYPIFPHLMEDGSQPEGLDACGGHEVAGQYIYHAGAPGGNAILLCLKGETGCTLEEGGVCDASVRRGPPGAPPQGAVSTPSSARSPDGPTQVMAAPEAVAAQTDSTAPAGIKPGAKPAQRPSGKPAGPRPPVLIPHS